ncbi:DnaA N-terminal domain-containing protein [Marinibacterium sp. SX1]|uniref:DnaA N-terminal domain-containing protein n=1 Tax=Marinibacterium sp. SX1 TaxID=3388424 RepID=UPI003D17BB86
MLATKAAGRNASAMKYDILSALGAHALSGDKHRQRLVLRVMVLVTTRYNWQTGELSIGRAEIARLWSVDERTVKREMAKLRACGWVLVKRAPAKGRVTVYTIDFDQVLTDTREVWARLGPDFADRLDARQTPPEPAPDPTVVPFKRAMTEVSGEDDWHRVLQILTERDPATAQVWFAPLSEAGRSDGTVELMAPSRFVAEYVRTHFTAQLLGAWRRVDPGIRAIKIATAG